MENNKVSKKKTVLVIVVSVAVVLFLGLGVAAFALKDASLRFEPEPDYKDRVQFCGRYAYYDGETFYTNRMGVFRASDPYGKARVNSFIPFFGISKTNAFGFGSGDSYDVYFNDSSTLRLVGKTDGARKKIALLTSDSVALYHDVFISDGLMGIDIITEQDRACIYAPTWESADNAGTVALSPCGKGKVLYRDLRGDLFLYDVDNAKTTPLPIEVDEAFEESVRRGSLFSDGERIVFEIYKGSGILCYDMATGEMTEIARWDEDAGVFRTAWTLTTNKLYYVLSRPFHTNQKWDGYREDSACGLWECLLSGDTEPKRIPVTDEPAQLVTVNDAVVAVDKTGRIVYDGVAAKQE